MFVIDWFKAGKGPDPKQARLDSQLDTYFANKTAGEATGADVSTSSATA
jgi:hypothetical protein